MRNQDASEVVALANQWFAACTVMFLQMNGSQVPESESGWMRHQLSLKAGQSKIRELSDQLAIFAEQVEISSDPYWALVGNFDAATDATWGAAQNLTRRLRAKAQAVTHKAPPPSNVIAARIAEDRYHVTRKTIREHIAGGSLTDHRPQGHQLNAPNLVDESEIAAKWPRRAGK